MLTKISLPHWFVEILLYVAEVVDYKYYVNCIKKSKPGFSHLYALATFYCYNFFLMTLYFSLGHVWQIEFQNILHANYKFDDLNNFQRFESLKCNNETWNLDKNSWDDVNRVKNSEISTAFGYKHERMTLRKRHFAEIWKGIVKLVDGYVENCVYCAVYFTYWKLFSFVLIYLNVN